MKRRVFAMSVADLCPNAKRVVIEDVAYNEDEQKKSPSQGPHTAGSGTGTVSMSMDEHQRDLLMMRSTQIGSNSMWSYADIDVECSANNDLHEHLK